MNEWRKESVEKIENMRRREERNKNENERKK